jgi:hypothetical protein
MPVSGLQQILSILFRDERVGSLPSGDDKSVPNRIAVAQRGLQKLVGTVPVMDCSMPGLLS